MLGRFFRNWWRDVEEKPLSYLLALFALCTGIACGLFFPRFLREADQEAMVGYASSAVKMATVVVPSFFQLFLSALWTNFRIAGASALSGFTRLGAPIALISQGIKGFGMGVFLYAVTKCFGAPGTISGILYLLPQSLFYIPAYTTLSARAMHRSALCMRRMAGPPRLYMREILPCLCAIFVGIMVECFISPHLLKLLTPLM